MSYFGTALVGLFILAALTYTLWPFFRPVVAEGLIPDEESNGVLGERDIARLLTERDRAYRTISEIEFDKEMGKLSEEDYAQMIAPARTQAMEVLRRLEARGVREGMVGVHVGEGEALKVAERLGTVAAPSPSGEGGEILRREKTLDERLEEEILRYRKVTAPVAETRAPEQTRFCTSCGSETGSDFRYCPACGKRLK